MKAVFLSILVSFVRLLMRTPLRRIPGGRGLFHLLYTRLAPSGAPTVVRCQGTQFCIDPFDIGVSLELLMEGVHDRLETDLFRRLLRPGMVVIDGGANIGYYSLIAATLVGEAGHVYAFEPEPGAFAVLTRSIELNRCTNITADPRALWNRPEALKLFVPQPNHGNSSLAPGNVSPRADCIEVDATSLDAFFGEVAGDTVVDLVKLDVQGAEGLALDGAERILRNERLKVILMEFWPQGLANLGTKPVALLDRLRNHGFRISVLDSAGGVAPVTGAQLIAECERRDHGKGYLNILLER